MSAVDFNNFYTSRSTGSRPEGDDTGGLFKVAIPGSSSLPSARHTNSNNNSSDSGIFAGTFFADVTSRARSFFSDEAPDEEAMELPQEQGYRESIGELLELTYAQRLSSFFISLGMGLVFLLIAISTGAAMVVVAPKKFAFFLTVGNIFCLFSTTFLVGVSYQLRTMLTAHRLHAALMYACSVVMTIYFAVIRPFGLACLVMAGVQVACLLWYCLSFVPWVRQFIRLATSSGWAAAMMVKRAVNALISSFS